MISYKNVFEEPNNQTNFISILENLKIYKLGESKQWNMCPLTLMQPNKTLNILVKTSQICLRVHAYTRNFIKKVNERYYIFSYQ